MHTHHYISDPDVIEQATPRTRRAPCRRCARRIVEGQLDGAIVGIGNAPTALIEVVRLIREEGVRPALVVGMPVGFVSAAESKDLLMGVDDGALGGHPRPQGRLDPGGGRHPRLLGLRRERQHKAAGHERHALARGPARQGAQVRHAGAQRGNRTGFTTGACSAAAARAATLGLLTRCRCRRAYCAVLPNGKEVRFTILDGRLEGRRARTPTRQSSRMPATIPMPPRRASHRRRAPLPQRAGVIELQGRPRRGYGDQARGSGWRSAGRRSTPCRAQYPRQRARGRRTQLLERTTACW
jgi:hypothetical protein